MSTRPQSSLTANSAYVTKDLFQWKGDLDDPLWCGPQFHGTVVATLAVATIVGLSGASPIRLLFASSIAGGIAPLTLSFVMLAATDAAVARRKPMNPS